MFYKMNLRVPFRQTDNNDTLPNGGNCHVTAKVTLLAIKILISVKVSVTRPYWY